MDQAARTTREIQTAIARVLLTRWDPIGIVDVSEASDEYDAYVGPVHRLLVSGATEHEIARYLAGIETTAMGLTDSGWRRLLPVARELGNEFRRLDPASTAT